MKTKMIPIAIITAALEFGTELLRAFNNLDPDQRRQIVQTLMDDDVKRQAWWEKVTQWFSDQVLKIKG